MEELLTKRQERDEAFSNFMEESHKATKHDLKARAARHKYIQAADEVRAMERDLLAFPVK